MTDSLETSLDIVYPESGCCGQYRLRDAIEHGEMTSFLRGEDEAGRAVMIQVPTRLHAYNEILHKRFARAVEILKAVDDEKRPAFRGADTYRDGIPYIVTAMPRGRCLANVKRVGVEEGLSLLRRLAEALARLHDNQIVHRNLRPQAIWVADEGDVQIVDYVLSLGLSVPLTRTGITLGTARYMAPEQIQGAHDVDGRADLYSLGIIMFELLTEASPFGNVEASNVLEAMKHLKMEPAPPSTLNGDIPADLDRILGRLLKIDPTDRYPTARDLVRELDRAAL